MALTATSAWPALASRPSEQSELCESAELEPAPCREREPSARLFAEQGAITSAWEARPVVERLCGCRGGEAAESGVLEVGFGEPQRFCL